MPQSGPYPKEKSTILATELRPIVKYRSSTKAFVEDDLIIYS